MAHPDELAERRMTYITLGGVFLALLAVFSLRPNKKNDSQKLGPFDLVLLGLSSYRMGRLIAFDRVMEPYRAPFTQTVPDSTGAGDTVEPKGSGWRRAIGELISCPICAGTWIAAVLTYSLELAPRPTRLLMTIMGAIGLGELFHTLTEALCWVGQHAREKAGAMAVERTQAR